VTGAGGNFGGDFGGNVAGGDVVGLQVDFVFGCPIGRPGVEPHVEAGTKCERIRIFTLPPPLKPPGPAAAGCAADDVAAGEAPGLQALNSDVSAAAATPLTVTIRNRRRLTADSLTLAT